MGIGEYCAAILKATPTLNPEDGLYRVSRYWRPQFLVIFLGLVLRHSFQMCQICFSAVLSLHFFEHITAAANSETQVECPSAVFE